MPAIRVAQEPDAACIVAAFGLPHARPFLRMPAVERVRAAMHDPQIVSLILDAEGSVVGHLLLRALTDSWSLTEIAQLVITQPGRGYGRFAVEYAKRFAFQERGAHRLCLETVADNLVAANLYRGCGFVHEGTFRDGFPADDGTFKDLDAYGMLHTEFLSQRSP